MRNWALFAICFALFASAAVAGTPRHGSKATTPTSTAHNGDASDDLVVESDKDYTAPPKPSTPPPAAVDQKAAAVAALPISGVKPVPPVTTVTSVAGSNTTPPKPVHPWVIKRGEQLSDVVARWSAQAGWQIPSWPKGVNYPIDSDAGSNGEFGSEFVEAITNLIYAYRDADIPLRADIYPLQRIVVITRAKKKDDN